MLTTFSLPVGAVVRNILCILFGGSNLKLIIIFPSRVILRVAAVSLHLALHQLHRVGMGMSDSFFLIILSGPLRPNQFTGMCNSVVLKCVQYFTICVLVVSLHFKISLLQNICEKNLFNIIRKLLHHRTVIYHKTRALNYLSMLEQGYFSKPVNWLSTKRLVNC